jgi:signal transduction histidine kinase
MKQLSVKVWSWLDKVTTLLGGRTIAMLTAALLISLVSVLFSDGWIESVGKQAITIKQVRSNLLDLYQLKSNIYKAESAQRGFLLTKRAPYLQPFTSALADARKNLDSLNTAFSSSTDLYQKDEIKQLNAITASLAAKENEMEMTLALTNKGKNEEAKSLMNLDSGMLEMNKLVQNADMLIKYETKNIDQRIEKLNDSLILARISVVVGALALILLVALVIKRLLSEISTKSHLQQQAAQENQAFQEKLKQQTKLIRSLALDYQADVERERQKLSRELHDELGSIFTATKMDLAWVIKKLVKVAPDVVDKLIKTTSYVDQGIQYQRHIVQELHPSMISTFGFWPALKSLINDAAERNNWKLSLNLPDETTPLNKTISLVAYRVVQESLNNANKYAKANEVGVDIMLDEHYLKVEIEDNGIGIDLTALDGLTHGLSGMRNRVLAIGGHFEILSNPNKGVLIRALIPLDVVANNASDF